jgi:hypothetical protein
VRHGWIVSAGALRGCLPGGGLSFSRQLVGVTHLGGAVEGLMSVAEFDGDASGMHGHNGGGQSRFPGSCVRLLVRPEATRDGEELLVGSGVRRRMRAGLPSAVTGRRILTLLTEIGDRPEHRITVAIEPTRGRAAALRETGRIIYPINPLTASRYGARYALSGGQTRCHLRGAIGCPRAHTGSCQTSGSCPRPSSDPLSTRDPSF